MLGIGHALGQKWVYDQHYGVPLAKRFYQNQPPTILDVPRNMKWAALEHPRSGDAGRRARHRRAAGRRRAACAILNALCRRARRRRVPPRAGHARHDPDGARAGRQRPSADGSRSRLGLGLEAWVLSRSTEPEEDAMAVIRDVMPVFELFQPATRGRCAGAARRHGADAWVLAAAWTSFDWLKDRTKRTERGRRPEPGRRAARHPGGRRRPRDRRDDDADRGGEHPVVREKFGAADAKRPGWSPRRRSATRGRSAATCRRTRAAGTTAAAGPATGPAATSATRTRRRRSTASTPFSTRTAAWR